MITELFQRPELSPFLISGALVFGFLLLEIALMALGLSSFGEADGPEANPLGADGIDAEVEFAGMSANEIAADLNIPPEIASQVEAAVSSFEPAPQDDLGFDYDPGNETSLVGTVFDFFGFNTLPLSASLAIYAACFASSGLAPQIILYGILGIVVPAGLLAPVAIVVAALMTRKMTRLIAALIPKEESAAISERSLGRRRGVVTVGVAKSGQPAEVKVYDGYGNQHYLMVEPLSAQDEIHEGSEVLVLRIRNGEYRLVKIS